VTSLRACLRHFLHNDGDCFWRVGGEQRTPASRKLFLASIAYLPLLLGALVVDRWLLA